MEVLLLGTGAADGIPNPFCRCDTCADHRRQHRLRTPTSVLVDNRLLIDPGPEAPRQVSRLGRDLLDCTTMLVSHAHSDHLDAAVLLHRSWVTDDRLTFIGPAPATDWARQWLDPDQSAVSFITMEPEDVITVDGYRIEALAANHHGHGQALCYRVSTGDTHLLYLTDTGPLPESTLAAVAQTPAAIVLLEETFGLAEGKGDQHHNLRTFATTVAALRECGAIDDETIVVPVHLGHDNPPRAELVAAMAAQGAVVLDDGAVLRVER